MASWSESARNIGKIQQRTVCIFIKVDQIFLKGHYGSTRIVPDSSFSEDV